MVEIAKKVWRKPAVKTLQAGAAEGPLNTANDGKSANGS